VVVSRIRSAAPRYGCAALPGGPRSRKDLAGKSSKEFVLRRVERIAYGMCALIAVITVLMEVKPF
jgi:hypothetical protein